MICPSVAYTADNSRTHRQSVPKFGSKIPHLRCDSHTSFKVEGSKVRVRGGQGHTVSAEPGSHTACYYYYYFFILLLFFFKFFILLLLLLKHTMPYDKAIVPFNDHTSN